MSELTRGERMTNWAVSVFGDVALNSGERALRYIEEAIEVAHAAGVRRDLLLLLVERAYGKQPGELPQEIGQAQMTLECLAHVFGVDASAECDREAERLMASDIEDRRARHAAKVLLGVAMGE